MQFKSKMILSVEKGLKEIEDKVKKTQDRGFKLMKGLHMDSQTSGQGKLLIEVNVMKENLSMLLDSLINVSSSNQNRARELHKLSGCIHVAMEELPY